MPKAPYPNLPYRAPNEESTNHLKPALPESAKVVLAGHSLTLAGAMVAVATWCFVGWVLGFPPEWFLLSNMFGTMATLFLMLGMQHSQNRDMHALQVKADELIRSSAARNRLIGVERREAEELAELADN